MTPSYSSKLTAGYILASLVIIKADEKDRTLKIILRGGSVSTGGDEVGRVGRQVLPQVQVSKKRYLCFMYVSTS